MISINLPNYQQTITANSPLSILNNALSVDLSAYLSLANASATYQTLSNMSSPYSTNTSLSIGDPKGNITVFWGLNCNWDLFEWIWMSTNIKWRGG